MQLFLQLRIGKRRSLLLSLLLIVSMLVPNGAWAISGSGTSSSPYQISSASDWATFRTAVSNASTKIYAKLTDSFTISSGTYTPVGTSNKPFYGEFYGQGNTITFDGATAQSGDFGLFGYVNNAIIQNLNVAGKMTVSEAYKHIGGIVGSVKGATTIQGCTFSGTITASKCTDSNGGIVGYCEKNSQPNITNCLFSGTFTAGGGTLGGILGYADDDGGQSFVGITNCFVSGTLSPSTGTYVGIFAGQPKGNVPGVIKNNTYVSSTSTNMLGNNKTADSSNKKITISVTAGSNGSVSNSYVNPTSTSATKLQVVATPGNHGFTRWSDSGAQTHTIGLTSNVSVTAYFNEHIYSTKSTTSTYKKDDATCFAAATYYYKCNGCDAKGTTSYSSTETKDKALGHNYAAGVWGTWSADGHSITCSRTCNRTSCTSSTTGHVVSVTATVQNGGVTSVVKTPATCTTKGWTSYTAKATVAGTEYTSSTKNVQDIAALGHAFAENDPNHTVCTRSGCGHSFLRYTATEMVAPSNDDFYDKDKDKLTYKNTFDSKTGKGEIEFNGALTSIGNYAFSDCSSLTNVTIPSSVTSIGNYAFLSCANLASITIPSSVSSIGNSAFKYCSSLTNMTIPNSVTSIGNSVFYNCSSLTNLTIPNSVTSIGACAFTGCSSLTNMTIPNSVTSIGNYAFSYCVNLEVVSIPNSVTSIGNSAFEYCCVLENNYVNNSGLEAKGLIIADSEQNDGLMIKGNEAVFCRRWATDVTIPNSVTSIGTSAFRDCSSLTTVTIPNSVTSIGPQAFYICSSLESISIPNSVTSIGDYAFFDCTSLTSVTIPNSVTSIGDNAFFDCTSLTSVTIPNSVTSIGDNAFYGCSSLPVENNIRYADTYLVEATDKVLAKYTIKEGTRFIGNDAFRDCSSLASISIPNSVTSIGACAFTGCSSLTNVIIPNSVTSIGNSAFFVCSKLASVKFQSIPQVGNWAFDGLAEDCQYTLALSDDSYVAADKGEFPTLSAEPIYSRTSIKNQWGTLVVPFDMEVTGEEACYDFYALSGYDSQTSTLSLTKVTGRISAGTPVLIRMSEAAKNAETGKYDLTLSGTADEDGKFLVTTALNDGSAANGLTLTGAYRKTDLTNANGYIISNNSFWNIGTLTSQYGATEVYIGAFRAYLASALSNGASQLRIGSTTDTEIETALEVLDSLTTGEGLGEVYDLNGHRLDDLQPGVNIIKRGNKSVKVILK